MRPFFWFSLAAYVVLLGLSAQRRNRFFLIFIGIILGLHTFSSTVLEPRLSAYGKPVELMVWYAQLATFVYFARFGRGQPNPVTRALISWPASWFSAAVF